MTKGKNGNDTEAGTRLSKINSILLFFFIPLTLPSPFKGEGLIG